MPRYATSRGPNNRRPPRETTNQWLSDLIFVAQMKARIEELRERPEVTADEIALLEAKLAEFEAEVRAEER